MILVPSLWNQSTVIISSATSHYAAALVGMHIRTVAVEFLLIVRLILIVHMMSICMLLWILFMFTVYVRLCFAAGRGLFSFRGI
jgi:hypothetical protein